LVEQSQERDMILIEHIRQGNTGAKEELVCKYLPMVKHIVRRHYAPFLEFDDLVQEGFIGLLAAINEYRPEAYNIKFSSFAYICIIRKVYNAIKQCTGNKHRVLNEAVSLHSFVNGDENRTIFDFLPSNDNELDPVEVFESKMIEKRVSEVLHHHLSLLEKTVVAFLIQGYTCSEIEEKTGVKAKAVDNARTRVKLKLRRLMKAYGSLLNPQLSLKTRQRRDLYMRVPKSG